MKKLDTSTKKLTRQQGNTIGKQQQNDYVRGKDKQTQIEYDIKGEEKNLSMSEKKEMSQDGYVCIYKCGKKSALQPSNACAQHRKRQSSR